MSTPSSRAAGACLAASVVLVFAMLGSAIGQSAATFTWRGESYPIAVAGTDFSVGDAARALGFAVSRDTTTGVLSITGDGHQVVAGPGTSQVPVDQRIVEISKPMRSVRGVLYAPADFFEKVLFPLGKATGTFDATRRQWTVVESRGTPSGSEPAGPLSVDVAVVHVEPTTQVVLRESASARFEPRLIESGLQVRWIDRKVTAPFAERRFDDSLVAAVRFEGDTATVVFREPGLTARAYPLTGPDRVVVEVGRAVEAPPVESAAPPPPAVPALTIVVDPGHGVSHRSISRARTATAPKPSTRGKRHATGRSSRRTRTSRPSASRAISISRSTSSGPRSRTTRRPVCFFRSTRTPPERPAPTGPRPTTCLSSPPTALPPRLRGGRTSRSRE